MDRARFASYKETIGTWKGRDWTPPSGWKNITLDGILQAVVAQCPRWDRTPTIVRMRRQAQNLLLKSYVTQAQSKELLNFDGTLLELADMLNAIDPKGNETMLRKALIELRSAKLKAKLDLFYKGALGFKPELAFDHTNLVLNAYLDASQALKLGTATSNQTLEVKTIEVGSAYSTPQETDTAMGNIIGSGKAPGEVDVNGYQTTWITHFQLSENNGATTTVAAVTSTTEFELTDDTGFAVGDRLEVQSSLGSVKTTITDLTASVATVDTAVPGVAISDPIIQIWGESGIKGNDDGTTLFTHSLFSGGGYTKTSSKSILVESAIIERSVGA